MTIVVLVGTRKSEGYQKARKTVEGLQTKIIPSRQILVDVADEIEFTIENNQKIRISSRLVADYSKVDLVLFRGARHYISVATALTLFLKSHSVKLLNAPSTEDVIYDKLSQFVQLKINEVSIPGTVFTPKLGALQRLVEQTSWSNKRFIVKSIHGAQGRDNYLLTLSELARFVPQRPSLYVAQEYIENSADYRVFCIGNERPLVIKRTRTGKGHQNNTALGAKATIANSLTTVEDIGMKAASLFGRDIIGVDVVVDTHGVPYILEVNDSPSLTDPFMAQKLALMSKAL